MESASVVVQGSAPGEKGLKPNAISSLSNIVIGVASTAPGYSLAATLGFVVAVTGVGLQAPAVLIVSFIPMLCIAFAYRYMNKADPDCGTTFAWTTRGMGPHLGWLNGWAIVAADVVVMATLAQIAAIYTFLLFGWDSAANSTVAIEIAGVIWIALMTAICYIGIELSARTQQVLLALEIAILTIFAVVALVKVYANNPPGSVHVSAQWFNPFQIDSFSALVDGVLLGVFIYWGWDSGVAVNEESQDGREGAGKSAVISTILLVLIYVVVSAAAQAFAGPKFLINNSDDVLSALGTAVFGHGILNKLLILAVLSSASASTQTTILPTARTSLSMARWRAIPSTFGRVHPRFMTPSVSTLTMGAASIIWFIIIIAVSTNVLGDSITALGFLIAFYYGCTGLACVIYYRRQLFKSAKNFFYVGFLPFAGFVMLGAIFVKAMIDYGRADASYSAPIHIFGLTIGTIDAIGIGSLLLGVVFMIWAMFKYPEFFRRRPEVAPEGILEPGAGPPDVTPIAPEGLAPGGGA